ncbi:MAG: class I tRNA ligase family protein, partial [Alphaproteobacteria bacterium]|nr:class I tRNA ligase family protein [Alphaproteobacteria bacterium]
QRYWGEPVPIIKCEKCGLVPVPEKDLPVTLPNLKEFKPGQNGESPLASAEEWKNTTCPHCGNHAVRETDTMPQWAGSSWYFLRYLDSKNNDEFCSQEQLKKWMPVDHYNGGMEHTTRHLLYSRFWYKVLHDLGFVPGLEPYKKRTSNGLIMAADGSKMSKSRGNTVPSSDVVERSGADACRMAILYLGPWEQSANWSEDTLRGVERFLKRVENLSENLTDEPMDAGQERLMHKLIADVTDRLENMRFNTAISAMMEFINAFNGGMPRPAYEVLLQMLNPFAPHMTEEMWEKLGHANMLVFEKWPISDATKLVETEMTIVVSINGKRAADFVVPADADEDAIVVAAKNAAGAKLADAEIVKTIVVPKKLINFVVKK